MDNEKNKIESNNDLQSIYNEYRDYNEYNKLNIQNNDYNEFTSFKEINDNKSSLRARKLSGLFTKLLSSALVITMAVVMGTSFIFGPKSKISEVFIEGYDTNLFISILFSEYYEDDDLELVIKNEFTDRVYKIEAFEEGPEEEKQYMYFADVDGLKENVSYHISIESGFNTLYKNDYVIEAKDDIPLTLVNRIDANYVDELIYVSVEFSDFNSDDFVLLQLEYNGEVIETIPIDQVIQNEYSYIYNNSFSVNSDGEYNVCLYVNNNLEMVSKVDVQTPAYTTVSYFGNEYGDLIFYYYIDFDNYVSSEIINLSFYLDGDLVKNVELDNIIQEEEYYRCDGEVNDLTDGKYDVVIYANNDIIYQEEIVLGYIWDTVLYELDVNNENTNVYVTLTFSEFSENEIVKLIVYKDDNVFLEELVANPQIDDLYYYEFDYHISEYGYYRYELLIDNYTVYIDEKNIVYNVASSSVSNVQIISFSHNVLVIVDIDEYDVNETLSIYLTSNKGYDKSFALDLHELATGAGYYAVIYDDGGSSSSDYSYTIYANNTAIITSDTINYQDAKNSNVILEHPYDNDMYPEPYISLDVYDEEYSWSYLLFNKNGNIYPAIIDANDMFEGTRLYVSLEDLEDGECCFILLENDGTNIEPQLWSNFTLQLGG